MPQRPKIEAPVLFTERDGSWHLSRPGVRMVPPPGSYVGFRAEDADDLQEYLLRMETELRWMREHPSFENSE